MKCASEHHQVHDGAAITGTVSVIPTLGPAAKKRAIESCHKFIDRKGKDGKEWRLPAKLYLAILKLASKTNSLVITDLSQQELMELAGLHNKGGSMPTAKQVLSDFGLVMFFPEDKLGAYQTIVVNNPRTRMPYAFEVPEPKSTTKNRRPVGSKVVSSWDYSG